MGKPQQDDIEHLHACMVDWEDLPAVNEEYKRFDDKIANNETTLRGRDEDNIRLIPSLVEFSTAPFKSAPRTRRA